MEAALSECDEVGRVKVEILAKIFSTTHMVASKRTAGCTLPEFTRIKKK